jgi:hypothetical protein
LPAVDRSPRRSLAALYVKGSPDGRHHQCVVSTGSQMRHERQRSYSRQGKSQQ